MNIAYILIGLGLAAAAFVWWKLRQPNKEALRDEFEASNEGHEYQYPPSTKTANYDFHGSGGGGKTADANTVMPVSPYLRAHPQPEPRHYDRGVVHTVAPATPDREAARRQQQQDDDDAAARRRRQQQDDDDSTTSAAITGAIIGEALSGAFDSSSSSSSIDTGSSIDAGGGSFGGGGADGSF